MSKKINLNRKLLIVDDELDIREAIREMVQLGLGAECILASNGKDALALSQTENPDAIISDIRMPKMSGLEFLIELRKLGLETPFVILTAFADRKNTVQALQLGALDFLEKPIDEATILSTLNKALECGVMLKRMERELDEFCKASQIHDQGKLDTYRNAKKAVLFLKIQAYLMKAKKAG